MIFKWRFCWPRSLNYILQVMEEERVNTGKSTEMELKVIIMTMVMISLGFPIFYPLFVYPSKQVFKFAFPPNFQVFSPPGSRPQQLDRADHRKERSNDQEDHGGHGQQDHGQLHQRHLLLQPRACDHHQGSNPRHFKSRSRGNQKPSSVFILVKTFLRFHVDFKVSSKLRAAYETDLQVQKSLN